MVPYLIGLLGLASGAIVALWLRWQLERARDDAALWREQSKRLTNDLVSAAEQVRRLEEVTRVLRSELKAQSDYIAALAAAHPDLVGEYVRELLRKAARLTSPGSHPPVSTGTAPALPVDSG